MLAESPNRGWLNDWLFLFLQKKAQWWGFSESVFLNNWLYRCEIWFLPLLFSLDSLYLHTFSVSLPHPLSLSLSLFGFISFSHSLSFTRNLFPLSLSLCIYFLFSFSVFLVPPSLCSSSSSSSSSSLHLPLPLPVSCCVRDRWWADGAEGLCRSLVLPLKGACTEEPFCCSSGSWHGSLWHKRLLWWVSFSEILINTIVFLFLAKC